MNRLTLLNPGQESYHDMWSDNLMVLLGHTFSHYNAIDNRLTLACEDNVLWNLAQWGHTFHIVFSKVGPSLFEVSVSSGGEEVRIRWTLTAKNAVLHSHTGYGSSGPVANPYAVLGMIDQALDITLAGYYKWKFEQ